jgi:hypothetical protein
MNFYEFWQKLDEMSRWKQGVPQGNITDPSELLAKRLRNFPNDHFITFRAISKIGLNPKPHDSTTPVGIYAFPITCITSPYSQCNGLHHWSKHSYVYVFKPKSMEKLLLIQNENDKQNYRNTLESLLQKYAYNNFSARLTAYFRGQGYDGIVDYGFGAIHPTEPTQAVFFGEQTITVVDMFDNPNTDQKRMNYTQGLAKWNKFRNPQPSGPSPYDDYYSTQSSDSEFNPSPAPNS